MNKANLITALNNETDLTKSKDGLVVNIFFNLNRAIFKACLPLAWLPPQRNRPCISQGRQV
jgi:hypothetical protein